MSFSITSKNFKKNQNPEPLYNKTGFYNKRKKFEGNEGDVCYRYVRFNNQSISVMNPKIDTLRFTLETKDFVLREQIHKNMIKFGNNWKPEKQEFSELKFGEYKNSVVIEDFPSKVYLLANAVKYTKNRFLQVCLHASNFSASDIFRLFNLLEDLSNGEWTHNYIYENSRILRMDWCVDFKYVSPQELGMWKASGTRGANFFIHKGLGNTGMSIEAKHPDKGKKHKKGKHNASKAYYYDKSHQSQTLENRTTRFEFRTFKEGTSIADNILSAGKNNLFKPYQVLDFAALKPEDFEDHEWRSFGDACKMRTFDNALSILPVQKQDIATKTLKEIEDRVWRANDLKKAMEKEASRFEPPR